MNPKFTQNSVVYLIASAKKGTIENFRIGEIRQAPSGAWLYKFAVYQRAPTATATVGDRNSYKLGYNFELDESELCTLSEALDFAELYLNQQLARIQQIRTQIGSS